MVLGWQLMVVCTVTPGTDTLGEEGSRHTLSFAAQVARVVSTASTRTTFLSLRTPLELMSMSSSKAALRRDFALERQLCHLESMCLSIKQQVPPLTSMCQLVKALKVPVTVIENAFAALATELEQLLTLHATTCQELDKMEEEREQTAARNAAIPPTHELAAIPPTSSPTTRSPTRSPKVKKDLASAPRYARNSRFLLPLS
jgi:hypothetical protein